MASRTRRKSIFFESGLFDEADAPLPEYLLSDSTGHTKRPAVVRFRSENEVRFVETFEDEEHSTSAAPVTTSDTPQQPALKVNESPLPEGSGSLIYRLSATLLLLAAIIPFLESTWFATMPIQGVSGDEMTGAAPLQGKVLDVRDDSPTDICFRWAQQSAIVNGTLYLYGGQAKTEDSQTENTWNNNFLQLDLTKNWQIDSPPLVGLPQPSGPPAVALGQLWNSASSLYLYGGEVSSQPPVAPPPLSLWEYDILDQKWIEHSNPITSSGQNAPSNGVPVQRAAEGAGIAVPSLGRGFYFGGHEDGYTTVGWSQSIPRLYLQSLLEFTFPGYTNDQVQSLSNGQDAGAGGVFRNVTVGGLQSQAGFTARADGLLIYVPGFGKEGILLALAGGTNETFTQMNEIDVYDIATSTFYQQSTSGPTPGVRVNPCAVVAAAADGSSYNIYMFGGQNLVPAGDQTQYDDMWILTVPSFTWIKVDQSTQSVPYGRSGATCNVWDAQMVMVGGYLGTQNLTCETPGIYVFDLSTLQWEQQFMAMSPGASTPGSGDNLGPQPAGFQSTGSNNPFNQQPEQIPGGMQGSYGYSVPEVVISVIGGGALGGATITKPIVTATGGPLQTGSAQTYTVTNSAGSTITQISSPTSSSNPSSGSSGSSHNGPNIAAIVVGVICGLLVILICYLLLCLVIYRKQLRLYKNHVEMAHHHNINQRETKPLGPYGNNNNSDVWEPNAAEGNTFIRHLESGTGPGSKARSNEAGSSNGPSTRGGGYASIGRDSSESSTEDLMSGQEPTFVGVMLNPRRSLRVINRD